MAQLFAGDEKCLSVFLLTSQPGNYQEAAIFDREGQFPQKVGGKFGTYVSSATNVAESSLLL